MREMVVGESTTLTEAKEWLRVQVWDGGAACPCCERRAQVYHRSLNSGMARSLIAIYKKGGTSNFVYIPTSISARSREEGKLRYWGLLEEERTRRPDGGRAGWWRVTERGREFILRQITVPKYVYEWDGKRIKFDGPEIDIRTALGTKFNYEELMSS